MNISKLFVSALVATSVGASATELKAVQSTPDPRTDVKLVEGFPNLGSGAGTAAPAISLSGVTGVVEIQTPGGVMTVKANEPIPVIPSGATIKVISGDVSVTAGKVTVKAGAGDSFTVTTNGAAVAIAVTGGAVSVTGADGKAQDVKAGSGVTLASTPAPAATAVDAYAPGSTPEELESIPAEDNSTTTTTTPPSSSPLQETSSSNGSTAPSPSTP